MQYIVGNNILHNSYNLLLQAMAVKTKILPHVTFFEDLEGPKYLEGPTTCPKLFKNMYIMENSLSLYTAQHLSISSTKCPRWSISL